MWLPDNLVTYVEFVRHKQRNTYPLWELGAKYAQSQLLIAEDHLIVVVDDTGEETRKCPPGTDIQSVPPGLRKYIPASALKVGDKVIFGSRVVALSRSKPVPVEKATELWEIRFNPDVSVETFFVPPFGYQTMGDRSSSSSHGVLVASAHQQDLQTPLVAFPETSEQELWLREQLELER